MTRSLRSLMAPIMPGAHACHTTCPSSVITLGAGARLPTNEEHP